VTISYILSSRFFLFILSFVFLRFDALVSGDVLVVGWWCVYCG